MLDALKTLFENDVVSEDPSWLYNGGSGREEALHTIYGSGNNYEPNLLLTNSSGLGYYKADTSGSFVTWTIS